MVRETKSRNLVFASRATSLIVAGCDVSSQKKALLPSLYCAEVAEALEASGIDYRCYDVPADLSEASYEIDAAFDSDIGSIVILHPFGLTRAPGRFRNVEQHTVLIEDACHALRSAELGSSIGSVGDLTVFSARKEIGWSEGGIALGSLLADLSGEFIPSQDVETEWRSVNIGALAQKGRNATRVACRVLGGKLPFVGEEDVLTHLPLLSPNRDRAIENLRDQGILAWRWIHPLKSFGQNSMPGCFDLRKRLLLVPLPTKRLMLEQTLELTGKMELNDWPHVLR